MSIDEQFYHTTRGHRTSRALGNPSSRPTARPPLSPREQRRPSGRPGAVQGVKRRSEPLTARTDQKSSRARGKGGRRFFLEDQTEQFPVPFPFQKAIESLHEAGLAVGIGLGDVFHVGADENQASGAALAVGGADPDLSAPDLFLKVIALASRARF